MKNTKLIWAALVAALGVLATPAQAQMSMAGFYAGVGVGQARAQDFCDGIVGNCDDKDTSWKIFAGYQFNENLGAELGYVDLGSLTASGTVLGVPFSANADAKTWELVGVGTFPISKDFGVFGKLGIHRWDLDVNGTIPGVGSASLSDSGTDLTFGAGVQWNFTQQAAARLYWQRYNDIGDDNTTGKDDVDVFGVSVLFKF